MSLGRLLAAGKSLIGVKEKMGRYQMRPAALLPKFGSDKNPFATPPAGKGGTPGPKEPESRQPKRSISEDRRAKSPVAKQSPGPVPAKAHEHRPQTARQITPSLFDPVAPENVAGAATVPGCNVVEASTGKAAVKASIEELSGGSSSTATMPAQAGTPYKQNAGPKHAEPNVTRRLPIPAKARVSFGARVKKLNPLGVFAKLKPAGKPAKAHRERLPQQAELSLERVVPVRNDLSDADLEVVTPRPVKVAKVPAPVPEAFRSATPVMEASIPEPTPWGRLSSRWFGTGQTAQTQTH